MGEQNGPVVPPPGPHCQADPKEAIEDPVQVLGRFTPFVRVQLRLLQTYDFGVGSLPTSLPLGWSCLMLNFSAHHS